MRFFENRSLSGFNAQDQCRSLFEKMSDSGVLGLAEQFEISFLGVSFQSLKTLFGHALHSLLLLVVHDGVPTEGLF
jgi:hypothetical protein